MDLTGDVKKLHRLHAIYIKRRATGKLRATLLANVVNIVLWNADVACDTQKKVVQAT
jgi:hypothetical protein